MQFDFHKVVINLPERSERLERFKMNFNRLHPDSTFKVIDGVRKQPVHVGIAEAHLNCIRHAKENGWDKVLIMEDDLYIPNIKANEYMNSALKKLPEDWDVALGGVYWRRSEIKINNLSEVRPKSWHWIKCNIDKEELIYRLSKLDYSNSLNTARQNSMGKGELVRLYKDFINTKL